MLMAVSLNAELLDDTGTTGTTGTAASATSENIAANMPGSVVLDSGTWTMDYRLLTVDETYMGNDDWGFVTDSATITFDALYQAATGLVRCQPVTANLPVFGYAPSNGKGWRKLITPKAYIRSSTKFSTYSVGDRLYATSNGKLTNVPVLSGSQFEDLGVIVSPNIAQLQERPKGQSK